MKLGSLFDGSGTAPLAAKMLGWNPVWASEIEPYPISVTAKRFPEMKHVGDITKLDGAELEPVDVIVFGSPCQDLSVAGAQKGILEGERSNLFFEAMRVIREMRKATDGRYPRYAIWENVPGAFSSNKGHDFYAVLEAFLALAGDPDPVPRPADKAGKLVWRSAGCVVGSGYSLAWRVLDAQFWGVPQRRRRIYLVCDLGGERAGEILFKRPGLSGYPHPCGAAWESAPGDTVGCADGSSGICFIDRQGCAGGARESCARTNPAPSQPSGTTTYAFQNTGRGWWNGGGGDAALCVYDARGNGCGQTVPNLTGDHENRVTDYTALCVEEKT